MCWHTWGKWTDKNTGRMQQLQEFINRKESRLGDSWIEQERRCSKCGKVQLRTETA